MSSRRLIVNVAGRLLALDLDDIEEVLDRLPVTSLPQLPSVIPGVVEVRGRAVPVIDLGALSGDEPRQDYRSMLIATDGTRRMALLIDGVERMEEEGATAGEPSAVLDVRNILGVIA